MSYRLLLLSSFPFQKKTQGTGTRPRLTKAKTLPAQWIPSALYICTINSGNAAEKENRKIPFAATAEAPLVTWYVLTRKVIDPRKTSSAPQPKGTPASTGTIQWTDSCGVHANHYYEDEPILKSRVQERRYQKKFQGWSHLQKDQWVARCFRAWQSRVGALGLLCHSFWPSLSDTVLHRKGQKLSQQERTLYNTLILKIFRIPGFTYPQWGRCMPALLVWG